MYISQNLLKNKIENNSNILIIDVRDDDYIGGHIKNSIHIPSIDFDVRIKEILWLIDTADEIILHCQESIIRSPRCAKLLSLITNKKLFILEGGFDKWVRKFWKTNLVKDYDDKYWYFENDMKNNCLRICS